MDCVFFVSAEKIFFQKEPVNLELAKMPNKKRRKNYEKSNSWC